ncbi:MAG: redoxin domain-containing protein [Bryobacterales bacterium]|nr:redoxin domain-containing protein [Bryobacterales bacterium]
MKTLLLCAVFTAFAFAQPGPADAEQNDLNDALSQTNNSPLEFIRALEAHLAKYPKSAKTAELERALAKAALDNSDDRRLVIYGERVVERNPDDVVVVEGLVRALLSRDPSKDFAAKALKHAGHYEKLVAGLRTEKAPGRVSEATWQDGVERGVGNALRFQARASGILEAYGDAIALAEKSFATYPNADSAREAGKWLAKTGRREEAIRRFADAFTIPDARSTDAERANDRFWLGELYRQLHQGSEAGLGDAILQAYDRNTALVEERRSSFARKDPNVRAAKIHDFTLGGPGGEKIALSSFKGKTLVLDFWATWCGPCRVQHPLYEKVKERFKDQPDVVFLAISTDEEREKVAPFLKENNWNHRVYFEDGLSRNLQISSIPTTIVVGRNGEIVSRLNGFLPDRFVDMLSERIDESLKQP